MSCLRYLCLFTNSGVQRILCCVFTLLFFYVTCFSGLSIFACPFGILYRLLSTVTDESQKGQKGYY